LIISHGTLKLEVGQQLTCQYPEHGSGKLINRYGLIEHTGTGRRGPYVTIKIGPGKYRNLSTSKMVNAIVS